MAGPTETGSTYVMYHWGASPAAGAVRGRDGFDQIGPLNSLGNLIVPNCEAYEHLYPVHFLQHELRCDAAGPGQFRGGTGAVYRVGDRARSGVCLPWRRAAHTLGVRCARRGGLARPARSDSEFPDGRLWEPPQFGAGRLGPATLTIHSPSGGGWGIPFERDQDLVFQDVRDGLLSRGRAEDDYGVVLTADARAVDYNKTADFGDGNAGENNKE